MARVWSALLVAALLSLATTPEHARFAWLGLFMAIAFWVLDAHFKRQELLMQRLAEHTRELSESEIDFSMDTSQVDDEDVAWGSVLLSSPLWLFHGAIVSGVVLFRLLTP